MLVKLMRCVPIFALLVLAGCVYYEDGYHRDDHGGYRQDRCYDTEYGRRCRYGRGEDDQGEDEQD